MHSKRAGLDVSSVSAAALIACEGARFVVPLRFAVHDRLASRRADTWRGR